MSTIWDLTSEQIALLEMFEEAESPEEIEAITTTLFATKEEFANKAEAYVAVITTLESREELRKRESDRFNALANEDKKKVASLKERLIAAMQATDTKSIDTNRYKISWRKGVPKAEIDDEKLLVGYNETKEVVSLNKRRLLEDLKAGKDVPGAHLGEGSPSLRIA